MGLGVIVSRSSRVTESMFMAAARTLAAQVTAADLAQGSLFPPLKNVRDVSAHIAAAVFTVALREGLAGVPEPANLLEFVQSHMYEPGYANYNAG
jgi:malate dehydrogenase (oxaloacetate-decarboxylating)(NADP+)